MSYNDCCNPCQGYYEPYESVENWHMHFPHISIPNPLEAIKEKFLKLADEELEPVADSFLGKYLIKQGGLTSFDTETGILFIHTASLQAKVKEDLENVLVEKYGSEAKMAADFIWDHIGTRAVQAVEKFLNTHLESITELAKKNFPELPIKGITVTESYLFGGLKKLAHKAYDYADKKVHQAIEAGKQFFEKPFIDLVTPHIQGFLEKHLDCKKEDINCFTEYDRNTRVLKISRSKVTKLFYENVVKGISSSSFAQSTCGVAVRGLGIVDLGGCGNDACCALWKKYAPDIVDKIIKFANEKLGSIRNYFTNKPVIYGLLSEVSRVETIENFALERALEKYTHFNYEGYNYEPYTYNNYCDC